MRQIQYGIISTASITARFIKAVQQTQHSNVTAIASRSLEKAQQLANELNVATAYGSYTELYEDKAIDIIYIATINDDHYSQIMTALSYNKHVICEKPFVLQKEQAEEIFRVAKEKQRFVMEAQKSVFLPITNYIKDIIMNHTLGNLKQIDMTSSFTNRFDEDHWMYDRHQGGALFGSASYTIEYISYLLNMPKLQYQASGSKTKKGCIEAISMQFLINDSILATSRISMNVRTKNLATFYFEDGYIDVFEYWKARSATIYRYHTKHSEDIVFACDYEMIYEVDHIYDCLQHNKLSSPIMTPEMTIQCVDIVEQMYHSI